MNKAQIFEKLNSLNLDKDKIIIISGASLVVQDIIEQTPDIDIATSTEYFNSINWNMRLGAFKKPVKYFDCFDISDNLYYENAEIVTINGFKFLNLKDILATKKALNRETDFYIIQKLEDLLNNKKL